MKDKMQTILNVAMLILLVLCFFKINTMQNDITNLRTAMQNMNNSVQNNIGAISNTVRNELEEANHLLSDSSWNTGGLNIEDNTATLACYVVPKVYNPNATDAALICNGKEVPMILADGRYTAELTIPLFEDTTISSVQFAENGTIRTQQLNWVINPHYDMVPTAYIHYSGESGHTYKGDAITRYYRGYAEVDFEHKGFTGMVQDVELVTMINGEVVERSNPVMEKIHGDEYISHYRTPIEQSFRVQQGDTIEMYMTITDTNGWQYRAVLEDVTIGAKGELIENLEHRNAEADIYDANGNLLFAAYKH